MCKYQLISIYIYIYINCINVLVYQCLLMSSGAFRALDGFPEGRLHLLHWRGPWGLRVTTHMGTDGVVLFLYRQSWTKNNSKIIFWV